MIKERKLGFTLIELLAVIFILAIIMVITTPAIMKIINESKKGAFKNSAYGIIRAAEFAVSRRMAVGVKVNEVIYTYTDGIFESNPTGNKLDFKGTKPQNGTIIVNSKGKIKLAIHNGKYCIQKDYEDIEVKVSEIELEKCNIITKYMDDSGAAIPHVQEGMIPIKWDGTKWLKADVNEKWYDYSAKEWANVVLVTEATRNDYINSGPGTAIIESDVMAYLVWVPRYRYKLFNVNSRYSTSNDAIDIVFENKSDSKAKGSSNDEWLTHPAFTFGDEELNGIWVGKFETTGTTDRPTIKPRQFAITSEVVSKLFETSLKFNNVSVYGLSSSLNSHMMKSTEWGAVVYLTNSIYGKNEVVWNNPAWDFTTGCAGENAESYNSACMYDYKTQNGQQASTTGNIYGVYDMNGGIMEKVMGAMYNQDNKTIMVGESGFDQTVIDSQEMAKYIDKYPYGTSFSNYNRRILGDATGETNGWGGYQGMPYGERPWLERGGHSYQDGASSMFYVDAEKGFADAVAGFRLVVS